LADLVADGLPT